MTDVRLFQPKSIDAFTAGDEVECIRNGNYSRRGRRYRVVSVSTLSNNLMITNLDGTSIIADSGAGPSGADWQRFVIVDDDANPNY